MQPKANFKTENCIPIAYIYMTLCTLKRHKKQIACSIHSVYVVALSPHKDNINSTSYGNRASCYM